MLRPIVAIPETRSVETTDVAGIRDRDANKTVKGRERQVLQDTMDLVLMTIVHTLTPMIAMGSGNPKEQQVTSRSLPQV